MSVNTVTLLSLKLSLWKSLGDYLPFDTTADITTSTAIVSTDLQSYDDGVDGAFDNWWVYIDGVTNIGIERKTGSATYATATGTLAVYGASLVAESSPRTCYLSRHEPVHIERAIQEAVKEIYPSLYLPIDDISLVAGNILPDSSFEDWATTTTLTWYATNSNTALTQDTTAGDFRYGTYGVKSTASAANGYFGISSNQYPRLLDLQGKSVSLYALAFPEKADDAYIEIHTIKNDGTTTQTKTSTTTNAAGAATIIKLESQALNDDLDEIQIRFKTATINKYVVWDSAVLIGEDIREYLLPTNLRDGHVSQVRMQSSGNQDPPCYDLHPFATRHSGEDMDFEIIDEGNWRYLKLNSSYVAKRRLRLTGYKPLETLSADTDTITLDAEKVPLLIEVAKEIFYERESKPVSSKDVKRYEVELQKSRWRRQELYYKHRMEKPSELLR